MSELFAIVYVTMHCVSYVPCKMKSVQNVDECIQFTYCCLAVKQYLLVLLCHSGALYNYTSLTFWIQSAVLFGDADPIRYNYVYVKRYIQQSKVCISPLQECKLVLIVTVTFQASTEDKNTAKLLLQLLLSYLPQIQTEGK